MSSKIKVDTIENVAGSGNVSLGSGHNLVVPGNITGQGTTTLTGDLAVDTNVLKVDTSNNRVGINTTSPSNDLHISSTNPVIRLQDTSTDAYAQIFTNDAGSMRLRADAGNSQGSSDFILEIDGTQQLSVDASGRMLKPNQPGFSVRHVTTSSVDVTTEHIAFANSPTTANNSGFNTGNHFNTSNGAFTAPVAGRYLFGVCMRYDGFSGSYFYGTLKKNGSSYIARQLTSIQGTYLHISIHAIAELAASDYMVFTLISNGDTSINIDGDSTFYGYLLG